MFFTVFHCCLKRFLTASRFTPPLCDGPGHLAGAPRDLMILSFDNQRASFLQANASKIHLNAHKR
jgi:hypothetical protein